MGIREDTCMYHEAHKQEIKRNKDDIDKLWLAIGKLQGNITKIVASLTATGVVLQTLITVFTKG